MILTNVACVESFHCSVVSFKRLHSLGMEWSSKTQWLEVNNLGYCKTPIHFEQWTIEYNEYRPTVEVYSAPQHQAPDVAIFRARRSEHSPPALEVDTITGHDIFGHCDIEAVTHIQDTCEGIKITRKHDNSKCQICRLGDSKQLISRVPTEPVPIPFHELV